MQNAWGKFWRTWCTFWSTCGRKFLYFARKYLNIIVFASNQFAIIDGMCVPFDKTLTKIFHSMTLTYFDLHLKNFTIIPKYCTFWCRDLIYCMCVHCDFIFLKIRNVLMMFWTWLFTYIEKLSCSYWISQDGLSCFDVLLLIRLFYQYKGFSPGDNKTQRSRQKYHKASQALPNFFSILIKADVLHMCYNILGQACLKWYVTNHMYCLFGYFQEKLEYLFLVYHQMLMASTRAGKKSTRRRWSGMHFRKETRSLTSETCYTMIRTISYTSKTEWETLSGEMCLRKVFSKHWFIT